MSSGEKGAPREFTMWKHEKAFKDSDCSTPVSFTNIVVHTDPCDSVLSFNCEHGNHANIPHSQINDPLLNPAQSVAFITHANLGVILVEFVSTSSNTPS
ncbi:hypothetical protein DMENIID0001_036690 [Sergentomyia squamirostris]